MKLATDPPVSEKQRKAMYAAAGGHSNLGIPQSVGKEFVSKDERIKGAGICFFAPDGEVLFIKRSTESNHPETWDFPGGKADNNETPQDAAKREAKEETGYSAEGELVPIHHQPDAEGVEFVTFSNKVKEKFEPKLDDGEHTDYKWAKLSNPPEPLHPGVKQTIEKMTKKAMDSGLAFDRGSVRTFDQDGRLHVSITNISKANVCPYHGSEIPDSEEMGLEPTRIYMLLRDPEELEKAAHTFNNLPLLSEHVPFYVDNPPKDLTIGSTGTDAEFKSPYLCNSLVVWDAQAIKGIENEDQKEISCGYRYRADMTPGTYEGVHYDGVMREIRGNHVALVATGRAGPDVVVGDSQLKEVTPMKKPLSRKAMLVKGALMASLPGRLAADAKPDFNKILATVASDNYKQSKPAIISAIKPMLAKDADIEELVRLLDTLDGETSNVEDESAYDEPEIEVKEEGEKGEEAKDQNPHEHILEFLRGKIDDADLKTIEEMLMGEEREEEEQGMDQPPEFEGKPKVPDVEKKEEGVSKAAMDEAIKAAAKAAEEKTIARLRDIAEAEKVVRPYVGELAIAKDSAEGVYKSALKLLGIETKGIHSSAYRAILEAQPKPGDKRQRMASDAKVSDDFLTRFPDANRIQKL